MKWFKAGAWGFVVGSIVTMIVGFSWGGWTTGGTASRTAIERANAAVTAALVPVCIEKSKADPARAKKLGALTLLWSLRSPPLATSPLELQGPLPHRLRS